MRLESEARTLSTQISDVQSRVTELRLADLQAKPSARILSPAYVLPDLAGPRPLQAAAAGLLVGLLAATLVVVVTARRRLAQ
jgi:uncharacterized protein involved in exopolysaccharide biosynthesis